ncbi:hypothetical protein H337_23655 [Vibrio parahaemolyticus EN9701121]|nr:hypothetical protein H337_23655 [Vibrio parahaemolyticus EN9701121]
MWIWNAVVDLYKTPMLNAPQQALNSNDKHFTVFAVVR